MFILGEQNNLLDNVAPFIWKRVEHERAMTIIRLFGKLAVYLPHARRPYYRWGLVIKYRPAQALSVYQFSPPYLRVILGARWECGLILGYWGLGLRLKKPLVWLRRVQAT